MVMAAGIGAAVGFVLDKVHEGTTLLLTAPSGSSKPPVGSSRGAQSLIVGVSPTVSSQTEGANVWLRF